MILKALLCSWCRIFGRKIPSIEKVYFAGSRRLKKELDVISLMKKLRIVDLLTSVVISEKKRAVIKFLEKVYLSEED